LRSFHFYFEFEFEFCRSQGLISLCVISLICSFVCSWHTQNTSSTKPIWHALHFFAPCILHSAFSIKHSAFPFLIKPCQSPRRGVVNRDRFTIGCPECRMLLFFLLLFLFNSYIFLPFFYYLHFILCLSAWAKRDFAFALRHLTLLRGAYRHMASKKKSHIHMQSRTKRAWNVGGVQWVPKVWVL